MSNDSVELVDVICEFFEVAIHTILHTRKLYPESVFVPKKKYGVVVYQSEHPLLNKYIAESLNAVRYHVKANQLRRLSVCISAAQKVLEEYVFEVLQFTNNCASDPLLLKLKNDLRSFCLNLNTSTCYLTPLPKDAEFRVEVHVTEYSALAFNEDPEHSVFPWIQLNPRESELTPNIVPVHTIDLESFLAQIYVQKFYD